MQSTQTFFSHWRSICSVHMSTTADVLTLKRGVAGAMDPAVHPHWMPDKRRLTAARVAGFALELAFTRLLTHHGLFELTTDMWATVDIKCSPKRPEATMRWVCFFCLGSAQADDYGRGP